MAKGVNTYSIQLPEALMGLIVATLSSRGRGTSGKVWTVDDLTRRALAMMVRKMAASPGRAIRDIGAEVRDAYLHAVVDTPDVDIEQLAEEIRQAHLSEDR